MTVMGVDMKFIGCTFTTTTNITSPIISYGLSRPQIDGPHYFIGCTFNSQYVYLKIQQGYSPIIIGNSFLNNASISTETNADYPSNEGPNLGIRIIGNEFELTQSGTTQNIAIAPNNTVGVGDYGMIITNNHFVNVSGEIYTNTTTYPGGFFTYGTVTHALIENNVFENLGNPIMTQQPFSAAIKNNVFSMTLSQTGTTAGIVYVFPGGTYFIDFSGNINDGYTGVFVNSGLTSSTGLIHDNVGISFTPTTPAVPASGTAQENTNPYPVNVYLYGGTVTEIQVTKNGTAYTVFSNATGLALSGQVYKLNPNDSITITYTSAPTWDWLSD
jgi:hypothetical protein